MGEQADEIVNEPGESTDEPGEVEIVIAGEETPPATSEVPKGIQRKFGKLTSRAKEAEAIASEQAAEAERLRRENELLRASQNARPRKADYEDDDDAYAEAVENYNFKRNQEATARIVDERMSKQAAPVDDFDDRVADHAQRAEKLKVPDYDETEDKAIEILGPVLSREIVNSVPKSELIMYHLGKNPAKAQEIRDLLDTNPVGATLALGRLTAELKVQPKSQRQLEPDTPLEGGSPGAADTRDARDRRREAIAKETNPAKQSKLMADHREKSKQERAQAG